MMYYCCGHAIKVHEVGVAPAAKEINKHYPNRVAIYDLDRSPKAWYIVDAARVKPTKAEAIWAAKDELDKHDDEICREMKQLQDQRDEIGHLLECGDPENDGT